MMSVVTATSYGGCTGMSSFYANSTYPEHVFLAEGNPAHIHEHFSDNNGWHNYDLTALSNGSATSGCLTSFYTGGSYPEHVFFEDVNYDVHELWSDNNGGWHDSDLTTMSHGAAPESNSPLTAFYSGGTNPEHVFCIESNTFHVLELYSDSNGWHYRDLTALSNGAIAFDYSFMSSFYRDTTYPKHVFFTTLNPDHVHELWSDSNGGWHDSDITALANGSNVTNDTGLFSFYFGGNSTEHVFYFDSNLYVHELWSDSNGWHDSDITALAGGVSGDYGLLTGFYRDASYPEHAFYVDSHFAVHELWSDSNGSWHSSVLP